MKFNRATYFSLFFLMSFLVSFGTNTYKNIQTSVSKIDLTHKGLTSFSNKETLSSSNLEFLYEENENETENDFHIQSFILPFFISYFQYEVLQPVIFSAKPLAEKLANPIYISVRNFRL